MVKVAANQDRAIADRTHYTYLQNADVATHRGHKILCREITESRVTPSSDASAQELLTLTGTVWVKNQYLNYSQLLKERPQTAEPAEVQLKDEGKIDVDLVEDLRHSLTNAKSKDGFEAGLFPLSGKASGGYLYTLVKREPMNGRDTWRIHFKPKARADDSDWEGDAWIDSAAYEPVLVRTRLAHQVPFLVKTMLGTNVPGLGFTVTYSRQSDGTWFPSTFGTEFKIHVLFFFSREITMSVQNHDFQKTHSDAHILDSTAAE